MRSSPPERSAGSGPRSLRRKLLGRWGLGPTRSLRRVGGASRPRTDTAPAPTPDAPARARYGFVPVAARRVLISPSATLRWNAASTAFDMTVRKLPFSSW